MTDRNPILIFTALALALALLARPAGGQPAPLVTQALPPLTQDRPLAFVVGSSVTWDSNVFRLPEPTPDRITTGYVGLRINQPYAQQRFLVDVIQSAHRYNRLSFLNFDPLQYRAAWQWQLGSRLSGTLSADRNEVLVNYGDFRVTSQRNINTAENRLLSVDAWLFGGWHLISAIAQFESRNSVAFLFDRGYRAASADAGIKYVTRSDSFLGFTHRSSHSEYLESLLDPVALLDDGFRRTDNEVLARWIITAKSSVEARVAHVDYRSNHFTQRDLSGMAGRLRYRWLPTATLSISGTASRELYPSSDSFNHRVEQRLSFGPIWQIGPRAAVGLSLVRAAVEFRQPVFSFATPRSDDLRGAVANLEWRLSRNVLLQAALESGQRTSTDAAFRFRYTATTLGAALTF